VLRGRGSMISGEDEGGFGEIGEKRKSLCGEVNL